jgi:hypothetical protein
MNARREIRLDDFNRPCVDRLNPQATSAYGVTVRDFHMSKMVIRSGAGRVRPEAAL